MSGATTAQAQCAVRRWAQVESCKMVEMEPRTAAADGCCLGYVRAVAVHHTAAGSTCQARTPAARGRGRADHRRANEP